MTARRFLLRSCLSAAACAAVLPSAWAEYHSFDKASDVQAAVQEVRWPYWAESTYNALYSQDIAGANKQSVYFYGGVPMASPGYPAEGKPPSIIWSFWPPHGTKGEAVKACFTGPNMYAPPHIGEGASGKVSGQWPLIQLHQWYRLAVRLWTPVDGSPEAGYIGQWLRDPATGVWHHYATMRLPFAPTGMTGLGGFLEDFSHGGRKPRRTDYRNVYYLRPNGWQSANHFTPSMRQEKEKGKAELIENGTAAYFEDCFDPAYQGNLDYDQKRQAVTLEINQPPQPSFDPIVVADPVALVCGKQVLVRWTMPPTSSPQLAYRIEVFDGPSEGTTPKIDLLARDPEARQRLLSLGGIIKPQVRLTITDIFDRTATPVLVPLEQQAASPAFTPATSSPGLDFAYYEGSWTQMPDFASLKPVAQGTVSYPDLTPRHRREDYAFRFGGFLTVPRTGLYCFALDSCDGSRLFLDDKPVVDHDGVHSPSEKQGYAVLTGGCHKVRLEYFFHKQSGDAGDDTDRIRVSLCGPDLPGTEVPAAAWSRLPTPGDPKIVLAGLRNGAILPADQVPLKAEISSASTPVEKVRFYVDDYCWGEVTKPPFTLDALLWNFDPIHVRARAFFGPDRSVDSPLVAIATTPPRTAPWVAATASPHVQSNGARVVDGRLDLIGDGLNLLYQTVEGDGTLVARVADIHPAGPAPDGKHPDWSWHAGIILRETLAPTPGVPLGNEHNRYAAAYATVNEGTHYQDHTMANAGGPFWSKRLGKQPWLKLERAGEVVTTSVSTDGTNWTVSNRATLKGLPPRLHAGVFTYAKESGNINVHRASFDNVRLTGKIVQAAATP